MPAEDSDGEEVEEEMGGPKGEEGERIGLSREGEFLRKLVDPELPSPTEVERHFLGGHLPYRSWCPVCVKSKGKEDAHRVDAGGEAAA